MGASTPLHIGKAEAKAFNVFMKKYIQTHPHQGEDDWNWNGTNAWGKLTTAQKKLFAFMPKVSVHKRRPPIPKKKRSPRPWAKRKLIRRLIDLRQKKIRKEVAKKISKELAKSNLFEISYNDEKLVGRPFGPRRKKIT